MVTERNSLDSPELGFELAAALETLYPNDWKVARFTELLANRDLFDRLAAGEDPRNLAESWREDVERFISLRAKYLLYK